MLLTKLSKEGKMFNSFLLNVCCTILLSRQISCARLYEERVSLLIVNLLIIRHAYVFDYFKLLMN